MAVPFGAPEEWPVCGGCGGDVEFVDCTNCGGEGGRDLYEEDPLAYAPGDWQDCEDCDGGVVIWCPNCGCIEHTKRRPLVVVSSERL